MVLDSIVCVGNAAIPLGPEEPEDGEELPPARP